MQNQTLTPVSVHTVATALVSRKFDYLQVHPDWFVYRLDYSMTMDAADAAGGFATQYPNQCREGFSPISALASMLAGGVPVSAPQETGEPMVVPAEAQSRMATVPTHELIQELRETVAVKKPFTALSENPALVQDLLIWCGYSHTFMDMAGTPLPQPLSFDYSEGLMCDGAYDLEKALEVLKKNPRVKAQGEPTAFYPERGTLRIEAVPYYNRRPGVRKSLSFQFTPTPEDLAKMVAHIPNALTYDDARRKAIFELDLLGLRAAGASRCATYEEYLEDDQDD